MPKKTFDFAGWATKNNILCSDGSTIKQDAFAENDGTTVPIVWGHDHYSMSSVLGHAKLKNEKDGVYFYGYLNSTAAGENAKKLLQNGDIDSVSICASVDKMTKKGEILHGDILEVSLVIAGANPGAKIETVEIAHAEGESPKVQIFTGEAILVPEDSEVSAEDILKAAGIEGNSDDEKPQVAKEQPDEEIAESKKALESEDNSDNSDDDKKDEKEKIEQSKDEGEKKLKQNIFESSKATEKFSVSKAKLQDYANAVIADAKENGSFKKALLRHANDYGIKNIDVLFPDAQAVRTTPDYIKREDAWVQTVLSGTSHSPFARIKSITADITADEARAKGYIKGNQKAAEVISVAQRVTLPTTIYKLQKLDRDDVIDITSFGVVNWILSEMRIMLDEEIARAILIGDGRTVGSTDKIKEDCVRPIYNDNELYTVKVDLASTNYNDAAEEIAKSKSKYKGTGTPTLFTTNAIHTALLWAKDTTGRRLYDSDAVLASALGVSQIVDVEAMEGLKLNSKNVFGIYVNLADYTIGTDRGGEINSFDDFDIDFNQYKYLIETRMSGALTRPYSAVTLTSTALDGSATTANSTKAN